MSSVQRSISFHGDHSVRDNKVDRHRCADVEDTAMDSLPVENILRPAIFSSRHDAEHVLHAKRDACPMVRLLILGMDTVKSDASTDRGNHR